MGKSNFVVEAGKNPKLSTPRTQWSNNRFYDWCMHFESAN